MCILVQVTMIEKGSGEPITVSVKLAASHISLIRSC